MMPIEEDLAKYWVAWAVVFVMCLLLVVVTLAPIFGRTQSEIDKRAEKKKRKKARSTDVLNVDSKGGN